MFSPDRVPDGTVLAPHHFYIGVIVATFAFLFVWRLYPRTGAALTLAGLLIALDDAVEHAFGVRTPLEVVGQVVIRRVIRVIEGGGL